MEGYKIMSLDVLGLVSIDTLDFLNGKSYVGGGGLSTAWISSLWNVNTTFYSINCNALANKIIANNISKKRLYLQHVALGSEYNTTHFRIYQDKNEEEYTYEITCLNSSLEELILFLNKSEHEQYIKLPASNFYQIKDCTGRFSVNPQGKFNLMEYCNRVKTSGFIFLNKKELLDCSEISFFEALEYIEKICRPFVITLGKGGAICYNSEDRLWWYCPSIMCNDYITTLGCGDSFAGGFLAAYNQKLSIAQCMAQGTLSAYCTMQAPSNMVTQWFEDMSLHHFVKLYEHIRLFESAVDLCEFLNTTQDLSVKISLQFDQTFNFNWLYT